MKFVKLLVYLGTIGLIIFSFYIFGMVYYAHSLTTFMIFTEPNNFIISIEMILTFLILIGFVYYFIKDIKMEFKVGDKN